MSSLQGVRTCQLASVHVWQHAWSIANQGSSPNFWSFYWGFIDGVITTWLNSVSSPPLQIRLISVVQSTKPPIIWFVFLMCPVPIPSYLLSISYLGAQHESLHCHKLPGMVPLGAHLNYKDTAITGEPLTEVTSQELGQSPAFSLRPNFLLYICQLSVLFIQKIFIQTRIWDSCQRYSDELDEQGSCPQGVYR